ncbi:HNH endonuclease [Vibrio vulnificus]|uniref:HNH endonuclease n=1 Tax=Vibrio vulnificus TaxID=672 RepID=UPI003EDA6D2F
MAKRVPDKNRVSIEKFLSFSGDETNETYERFKKIVVLLKARDIRPYVAKTCITAHVFLDDCQVEYVRLTRFLKTGDYVISVRVKKKDQYEAYFNEPPKVSSLQNRERAYALGGREMLARIIGEDSGSLIDDLFFGSLKNDYIDSSTLSLESDIAEIRDLEVSSTEKERLVATRLGQGDYRKELITLWGGCSLTKCKTKELLVASHIKPWRVSDNQERLDSFNGLLLVATVDKAFDSGLISFSNDGSILISAEFEEHQVIGIHTDMRIELKPENVYYLAYHREHVYRG